MNEQRNFNEKVSRLPGLPDPLPARTAAMFEDALRGGGHILNLHLLNAHAPALAEARRPLIAAMRSECAVARLYRELAITRTAQLVECAYEEHHHLPFCRQCGMSEEAVAAIARWRDHAGLFDAPQRAVLAFVDEMCAHKGKVGEATFAELARHFSPQEIVELTMCATAYYGAGMYMRALELAPDAEDRKPAPGAF